ncbi:ABC transporter substrate-binding protein [Rhizobium sp. CG4]|uniref:CmpA/NrtA family ABC transporter substrate-binding protein n=1 Tax=Rhizobium sp. CG4 TaxID=2726075 RepID=UPI00203403AE|nr:CmpA/NrtA family ABC transporter substrate-binding protein [Rhizobium sp. CG4]MCM2456343.1 ABC transporter substrate-binding protein [Rhizobium sp. CG4]
MPDNPIISVGFSPSVDSAILAIAAEKGFAADEGVRLSLVRKNLVGDIVEALRDDELSLGQLPATFPVLSALQLAGMPKGYFAPFTLSLGGASLVVSPDLHKRLEDAGALGLSPSTLSIALSRLCGRRRAQGLATPLKIAVESRYGTSWYELRYMLAHCRIAVPTDVSIVISSPQAMPYLLEEGTIDGFYAPEPFGSASILNGTGFMATTKSNIWHNSPERVLAVSQGWAEQNMQHLEALLRALYRAGQWCANASNIEELTGILAAPKYLGEDGDLILPSFTGFLSISDLQMLEIEEFFVTSGKAANFPWQSQALWYFNQMMRWGDCPATLADDPTTCEAVRDAFRPDIFRKALKPLFAHVPSANLKMEGTLRQPVHVGSSRSGLVLGPDMFFDGRIFDPERFDTFNDL